MLCKLNKVPRSVVPPHKRISAPVGSQHCHPLKNEAWDDVVRCVEGLMRHQAEFEGTG